jgi:TRAP-type mannitol/chloroaromatic compound transport system substrate-binding protein
MLEFIINRNSFEALPADLQAIVTYAARAVNQDMLDQYDSESEDAETATDQMDQTTQPDQTGMPPL